MMFDTTLEPMSEVKSHLDQVKKWCGKKPYTPTVWVTMLYGSQNYGLDSADSDVDTKTMLLPSFNMVLMDTARVSTEVQMRDGSLDNCKDLREMFGNYLKGNINFVETLYTPYYVADCYSREFEDLRAHRNAIANAKPRRLMHMAGGMAKQKYEAFDHPFEGKREVLEKYGYDPKQLHHLVRLYHFMRTYRESCNFYAALFCAKSTHDSTLHDYLMRLKLEPFPVDYARELREEYMAKVDELVAKSDTDMPEDNGYADAKAYLDQLACDLMKKHLKSELFAY